MRIAIVDDQKMAIEATRRIIRRVPGGQLAWIARDGAEAVRQAALDTPDLILMDLVMPVMDGVEATRRIMAESPCAILVVTASISDNTSLVFQAMGHGALDAVNTPVLGLDGSMSGAEELLARIETARRLTARPAGATAAPAAAALPVAPRRALSPASPVRPLVAIGASTGGPRALARILADISPATDVPIVIVQHVDQQFAGGLVQWLSEPSRLPVAIAVAGDRPVAGEVRVAATNDHLVLTSGGAFRYTADPVDYPYRPSVDVFFESLLDHWAGPVVGVLLTGMGKDGARGLLALRERGAHTIAQDQASSIVYGMPRAAAEIGAAVEILPADAIGAAIGVAVRRAARSRVGP